METEIDENKKSYPVSNYIAFETAQDRYILAARMWKTAQYNLGATAEELKASQVRFFEARERFMEAAKRSEIID